MALDLWFPEDVTRILLSLARAELRHGDSQWHDGYMAALEDVGTAFGICPPQEKARSQGNFLMDSLPTHPLENRG